MNAQLQHRTSESADPATLERYELFPGADLHVRYGDNGLAANRKHAGGEICNSLQLVLRDRAGDVCDSMSITGDKDDGTPLHLLHSLFKEHSVRPAEKSDCITEWPDTPSLHLHQFLTTAEEAGCQVRSKLGDTPDEIVQNFAAIAAAHLPTLEQPRKVVVRSKGHAGAAADAKNAPTAFAWLDFDIAVPPELHDIDDFRSRLIDLLPGLLESNSIKADEQTLAESIIADCRAFAVHPISNTRITRERVFVLIAKDLVITAHDGDSRFLEQHHAHYYGEKPHRRSKAATSGDFFLNLYEHGLSINRRVVQQLDERVVKEIKRELQQPGRRLSEETVRRRIPEISDSLDHIRRKLNEESSVFSNLLRQIETEPATTVALFDDVKKAADRARRIKQDAAELSDRTHSMSSAIAQAKDSNIALLTMQGGEIAKKIAILGAAAIPLTMAFAAVAIPECPVSWKVPLVSAALFIGGFLITVAKKRQWW